MNTNLTENKNNQVASIDERIKQLSLQLDNGVQDYDRIEKYITDFLDTNLATLLPKYHWDSFSKFMGRPVRILESVFCPDRPTVRDLVLFISKKMKDDFDNINAFEQRGLTNYVDIRSISLSYLDCLLSSQRMKKINSHCHPATDKYFQINKAALDDYLSFKERYGLNQMRLDDYYEQGIEIDNPDASKTTYDKFAEIQNGHYVWTPGNMSLSSYGEHIRNLYIDFDQNIYKPLAKFCELEKMPPITNNNAKSDDIRKENQNG